MDNLSKRISTLLAQKPIAVIGIDGCCASGKTTLAARLAEQFNAQVIHMDDFFFAARNAHRGASAGSGRQRSL